MDGVDIQGSISPVKQPATEAMTTLSKTLRDTQPWTRLMAIVGFVAVGFMVLVGVAAGAAGIATGDVTTAAMLVLYPLFALLYVFPSVHLLRYSRRIREFVSDGQQSQLEAALDAQRAFWKFIGISTLAYFGVAIVIALVALVAGMASVAGTEAAPVGQFKFEYDTR